MSLVDIDFVLYLRCELVLFPPLVEYAIDNLCNRAIASYIASCAETIHGDV